MRVCKTKIKFCDLTSVAQDLMHYFDTRGGTYAHHNITSQSDQSPPRSIPVSSS